MDIDQNKLREIILRVLREFQNEAAVKAAAKPDCRAYVYCGEGRDDSLIAFLKDNKEAGALKVTAVLPKDADALKARLIREELVSDCCTFQEAADASVKIAVYPSFGRTSLAEAAMGMDRCFSSAALRKDFEAGRRVFFLTKGIDPFTGLEPKAYQDLIISYIRTLAGMGVAFIKGIDEVSKAAAAVYGITNGTAGKPKAAEAPAKEPKKAPGPQPVPSRKPYRLKTDNNLLTAADIRQIPYGYTVYLSKKKVLTPMARDAVMDLNLKLVRE